MHETVCQGNEHWEVHNPKSSARRSLLSIFRPQETATANRGNEGEEKSEDAGPAEQSEER